MIENFKKFIFLLSSKERVQFTILIFMMLVVSLIDVVGIASIMPFIVVISNPEIVETNQILKLIYETSFDYGIETKKQFIFYLGLFSFILLIVSISSKAITDYSKLRFCQMREYSIGKRLVEGYLNQPYSWFLNRHSADLGKTILSEIGIIVGHGITPMMELIAKSFVTITLLTLLILINPKIAIIAGFVIGISYAIIYKFSRNFLKRIGNERVISNRERFTAVSEAFNATKEVKIGGLEDVYINRFAKPANIYARHQASSGILSQLPRYALEVIAFGGMMLVILFLMLDRGNFASILPVIALYAFAGYRLMPALQGIYVSITQLRFVTPSLDSIYQDLKSLDDPEDLDKKVKIILKKNIILENVFYDYPNSSRTALKNININIPLNTTVGIVGKTGSGKTTTVDIILGLLEAKKGVLKVDGEIINSNNRRAWQSNIGYVPQHINLIDDSIAANIAFGIAQKNINYQLVEKASIAANLHDFVINELSEKYQTIIGEHGIRLSGGQRQRIGIARALYNNPKILILDEATSSLDSLTEKTILQAVYKMGKNKTVILITHRLSTVKNCDNIFLLKNGELIGQGTYDNLNKTNIDFQLITLKN